uniref:Choline transporter-like protein n=1 Tax=Cyprinus carpio TaxID=7962 RepID=A0A8C2IZH2_CYPCA
MKLIQFLMFCFHLIVQNKYHKIADVCISCEMVLVLAAWLYGDPRHVLYPRNSTGMFCGVGQNNDKPSVMYFDIIKCATATNIMAAALQGLQCPTTQLSFCPSHLCDVTNSFNIKDVGLRIFEDFAKSWQWIVAGLVIAMVVSVLFLLLLRFTAPVLVWVLIIGVLAVGAFGIWYCYNEYMSLASSSLNFSNVGLTTNVQVYLQVRDTWLAFCEALGHMMSTLFYPIVTFVLLLVCVSYWGITALYLATSGAPVYKVVAMNTSQGDCSIIRANETCDPEMFNTTQYPTCPSARCVFINYNTEGLFQRNLFNLQIYNVFAFLWCVNFVIALGHCTLAGAFGSYYWAFSKPADIPTFPLIQSFMRALRYHVGSLAFGALILTLVQMVRIILEYLDHKFKVFFFVLVCFLFCSYHGIKLISNFRSVYLTVASYKLTFTNLENIVFMVVVLDKVTDLLLFFGKLLVVGGVGVLAFFFFSGRIQTPGTTFETAALNYYWMPIITVVFGAYLIAHGFFSVYNMGVDTLFLCFLEDLERNDGSPEKPYFMSKNLMKILNKKNKAPKTS